MVDEEKSPPQMLKESLWKGAQRLVVTAVLFGAGVYAGYFQWGDAASLRLEKKQLEDQIVDLKNQRETLSTRIAREQRDKEVCRKELAEAKKSAPAAAGD
jgi:cell division protein FtsB